MTRCFSTSAGRISLLLSFRWGSSPHSDNRFKTEKFLRTDAVSDKASLLNLVCACKMVKLRGATVLTLCGLATACLITNCPKGGKRSKLNSEIVMEPQRSCVPCGPELLGRCVGPAICCGPRLGCLMGAPGILPQCERMEMFYPPPGRPCLSPSGLGVCASDGVCCDMESCRLDVSCEIEHVAEVCSHEEVSFGSNF